MKTKLFLIIMVISIVFCVCACLTACGETDHVHTYSDEWTSDNGNHWHAATCEHAEEVSGFAPHVWDSGVVVTDATETAVGEKKYTCTVCRKEKTEDIPVVNGYRYKLAYGRLSL